MSAPETMHAPAQQPGMTAIDVAVVGARVLATPEAIYTLTPIEAIALAGYIVQQDTGAPPALVAPARPWWPTRASLAAEIARLLEANLTLQRLRADASSGRRPVDLPAAVEAFNTALAALQTAFEEEFPDGRD